MVVGIWGSDLLRVEYEVQVYKGGSLFYPNFAATVRKFPYKIKPEDQWSCKRSPDNMAY